MPTSPSASKVMRGNRGVDTRPEVAIRSLLHKEGLRFRVARGVQVDGYRTRPDIMFPREKVVVYVDGCFWHSCPKHGNTPKSNGGYWAPKLADNVARDRRINAALRRNGWHVLRYWEHQPSEKVVAQVSAILIRLRS